MKILCFVQDDDNAINPVSKEAIALSQEIKDKLNGELDILTFSEQVANELSQFESNQVLLGKSEELEDYNPLYYTSAVDCILNNNEYELLIIGHTYQARDWAPRLSARRDIPFISDCIDYSIENTSIEWIRSLYRAKINSQLKSNAKQTIISFQSGCFRADKMKGGTSEINAINVDLGDVEKTITPGEKFKESGSQVDLTSSDVIVSIGRGIGKEENIPLAKELAELTGGLLASSRPVVDSGWLDHSLQIGSSGQVVSPKLYLALGISGAIQHVVGMKGSNSIISINKDPNAPIFELSDYGVVGDLLEIVPKLNEAIKEV